MVARTTDPKYIIHTNDIVMHTEFVNFYGKESKTQKDDVETDGIFAHQFDV